MTDDINRKDVDDYGRRNSKKNSYKNRYFNGKRTAQDEYTGKILYYSNKGLNSSSGKGRHYTSKTTANTDHVKPIDQVIKKYGNEFSKKDLKDIANSDYNLAITSESMNKAKKAQSNHEYLWTQLKNKQPENVLTTYNMLKQEVQSELSMGIDVTTRRVVKKTGNLVNADKKSINKVERYAGKTAGKAVDVGASAAIMSLTVSGLNNLALVASGEKDIKDATIDTLKDTSGSFISGVGLELVQNAIISTAKKGGNKEVIKLLGNGLPIAEVSAVIMVGNSVIRFVNDEITTEECVTEILMNGAGAVAFSLGMSFGGPAGAIVASMVVAQISKAILDYRAITKMTEAKIAKVNSIVAEALIEMEYQRNYLKQLIDDEYSHWDEQFDKGFEEIFVSALSDDSNGISQGLDRILNVFGENVRFKNDEEFDAFFDSENKVFSF